MTTSPTADVTTSDSPGVSGAELRLDRVTNRYPSASAPAVEEFTMTNPAGKILVFVGPSGCGKTTTMRMLNRMVEPTSGTIAIGSEDALHIDPDQLRRTIGYAI